MSHCPSSSISVTFDLPANRNKSSAVQNLPGLHNWKFNRCCRVFVVFHWPAATCVAIFFFRVHGAGKQRWFICISMHSTSVLRGAASAGWHQSVYEIGECWPTEWSYFWFAIHACRLRSVWLGWVGGVSCCSILMFYGILSERFETFDGVSPRFWCSRYWDKWMFRLQRSLCFIGLRAEMALRIFFRVDIFTDNHLLFLERIPTDLIY